MKMMDMENDEEDIINLYEEEYNFDNDKSIIDSFQKYIGNMILNINLNLEVNLSELDIS